MDRASHIFMMATCIAGAISAGTRATTTVVKVVVSGDNFSNTIKKTSKADSVINGKTDNKKEAKESQV